MSDKYRKSFNNYSSSRFQRIKERRLRQSREYILKKKKLKIKFFALIILIILILLSLVYYLLFSGFSEIKRVEITKINDYGLITNQKIQEIVNSLTKNKIFFISRNNIVFFSKKSLEKILKNDSRIQDFTIKKKWLDRLLLIKVSEFKPVALLISFANNKNLYLNQEGEVIYVNNSDFTTPKSENLPIFYDQTKVNLNSPEYIRLFKAVLGLINNISSQNNIKAEMVKISEKASIFEVEMTTNEQWRILINSEADFEQQKNNLDLILNEINDRTNLEQIDLRFGENIFYKPKK